jgi:hypothetical protein
MMMLPRLHLWIGAFSLLVFLLTGQYMARVLNVPLMDEVPRLLHRSSHLYIFYAATANILIGLYYRPAGSLHAVYWLNGLLIMASPIVLIYSFFAEAGLGQLDRSGAYFGAVMMFAAVANTIVIRVWVSWRGNSMEGES